MKMAMGAEKGKGRVTVVFSFLPSAAGVLEIGIGVYFSVECSGWRSREGELSTRGLRAIDGSTGVAVPLYVLQGSKHAAFGLRVRRAQQAVR